MGSNKMKTLVDKIATLLSVGRGCATAVIEEINASGTHRIVPAAEIEAREEKHREALYLAHKEIEKLEARLSGVDAGTHQIVPKEPTDNMQERAFEALQAIYHASEWEEARDVVEEFDAAIVYRAMLAAAPAEGEKE